ncbi:DUF4345 family protein [Oricola sp.]|uniref:AGROH133_08824 family phage infection protein n=1 Tax=Oricola sp. TaxID=1979950 RepID=UPI0025FDAEE6|nr:DUF4345 family protein [Oricola sp.]MCI5077642.1 DUF4345 family protein [Oricola sp.]
MFSIIPPQSPGEWLAWASALVTLGFGLICLLTPGLAFRIMRLRTAEGIPQAVSESRATMAGFYLGVSIFAILVNQPFVWMTLGAGWAFTAFGRLVSILVDRGNTSFNWISIVIEAALAAAPLLFALGVVA